MALPLLGKSPPLASAGGRYGLVEEAGPTQGCRGAIRNIDCRFGCRASSLYTLSATTRFRRADPPALLLCWYRRRVADRHPILRCPCTSLATAGGQGTSARQRRTRLAR